MTKPDVQSFAVRHFYLRQQDQRPFGCVAIAVDPSDKNHRYGVGISLIDRKDRWKPTRGRDIAIARACKAASLRPAGILSMLCVDGTPDDVIAHRLEGIGITSKRLESRMIAWSEREQQRWMDGYRAGCVDERIVYLEKLSKLEFTSDEDRERVEEMLKAGSKRSVKMKSRGHGSVYVVASLIVNHYEQIRKIITDADAIPF